MQQYDVRLKLILQSPDPVALRALTGELVARWHDVELPQLRQTRVDLLGETTGGNLVHIELQSSHDSAMPLRMLEYCAQIYRLHGRFPRQILLYLGHLPLRMEAELAGGGLSFRYELLDARDLDGEPLLGSSEVGDHVIAILTRLGEKQDSLRRILKKIVQAQPEKRRIAFQQLLVPAGLRRLEKKVVREAEKMPVLYDIMDHQVIRPAIRKGLEQGREEGIQQGREEGRQQGELTLLLRQITKRDSGLAAERLARMPAVELEELGVKLLDARSLEELMPV